MRRIELDDPGALEGRQILKATELRDLSSAAEILAQTRAWSEAHRAGVAAELDALRAEASVAGHAAGLTSFADAVAAYARAADALEARLMGLLRACLERVFDTLPAADVLHDLIAPVLRDIRTAQEISVLVHPDALPALRGALDRLETMADGQLTLSPRIDPGLGPKDCLIYTEDEVFNVGIPLTCDLLCRAITTKLEQEPHHAA